MLTGVAPETIGMVFCATICSEMALLNISSLIWRMKDRSCLSSCQWGKFLFTKRYSVYRVRKCQKDADGK